MEQEGAFGARGKLGKVWRINEGCSALLRGQEWRCNQITWWTENRELHGC